MMAPAGFEPLDGLRGRDGAARPGSRLSRSTSRTIQRVVGVLRPWAFSRRMCRSYLSGCAASALIFLAAAASSAVTSSAMSRTRCRLAEGITTPPALSI